MSGPRSLDVLREAVVSDPALRGRLSGGAPGAGSGAAFARRVVELAESYGLTLTPGEVEDALRSARQRWTSRWV